MAGQTPPATPFGIVEFRQLMKSASRESKNLELVAAEISGLWTSFKCFKMTGTNSGRVFHGIVFRRMNKPKRRIENQHGSGDFEDYQFEFMKTSNNRERDDV